ncbi:MAG: LamG-like jellyroll fold domain-containing protein [Bacteroidia bacterium]|jgi:hypothetical protein
MKQRMKLKPRTRTSLRLKTQLVLLTGAVAFLGLALWGYFIFVGRKDAIAVTEKNAVFGFSKKFKLPAFSQSALTSGTAFPVLMEFSDKDFRSVEFGGKIMQPQAGDVKFKVAGRSDFLSHSVESYDAETGTLQVMLWIETSNANNEHEVEALFGSPVTAPSTPSQYLEGITYINLNQGFSAFNKTALSMLLSGTHPEKGFVGNARVFDRRRGDFAVCRFSQQTSFFKEFSIQFSIFPLKDGSQFIFGNLSQLEGFRLFVNAHNQLELQWADGAEIHTQIISGTATLPIRRWSHISLSVFDGGSTCSLILNGSSTGDVKLSAPIAPAGAYLRWGRDTDEDLPGTFAKIDQIMIAQKSLHINDLALWQRNTSGILKPALQSTEILQFNRQNAQEVRNALLQKNSGAALQNEQKYRMTMPLPSEQANAKTKEQISADKNARLDHLHDVASGK